MMARSLALTVLLAGCLVHTHETPDSSMTSTTRSTNATAPAPYDPHFLVSDQIYESCQLASKTNMDVAEGTAWCMKTGPMSDKKVRIRGSQDEVDRARARLVGWGVAIDRIYADYESGPATIDVMTLNLRKR
jgi:hypothetical protein